MVALSQLRERLGEDFLRLQIKHESAMSAASLAFSVGQMSSLSKEILVNWHDLTMVKRRERHDAKVALELLHLKDKQDKLSRLSVGLLSASQGSLMVKQVLDCWTRSLSEARYERLRESMTEDYLRLKNKFSASVGRTLWLLSGVRLNLVMKEILTQWWELVQELHREGVRNELALLVAKRECALQAATFAFFERHVFYISEVIMMDWHRIAVTERRKRHDETMALKILSMNARQDKLTLQSLRLLSASHGNLMLKEVLANWTFVLQEAHLKKIQGRMAEDHLRFQRKKDMLARGAIVALSESQRSWLLNDVVTVWRKLTVTESPTISSLQQVLDDLVEVKSKHEQLVLQSLGLLIASQGSLMVKDVLAKWIDTHEKDRCVLQNLIKTSSSFQEKAKVVLL